LGRHLRDDWQATHGPDGRDGRAYLVCRLLLEKKKKGRTPRSDERKAEGFIWRRGVVWIGQSVLVMPPADAAELNERLQKIVVRVAKAPVSIERSSLEAFRRGREGSA